jgi:hypothetical protein
MLSSGRLITSVTERMKHGLIPTIMVHHAQTYTLQMRQEGAGPDEHMLAS